MLYASLQAIKSVFKYLPGRFRFRFGVNIVFSIILSGLELLLAGIVSLIGVSMVSPAFMLQQPAVALLLTHVPSLTMLFADQMILLVALMVLLFFMYLIKIAASAFLAWYQSLFSQNVGIELGHRMFSGFLHAPYLWHIQQDLSRLMTDLSWRNHLVLYLRLSLNAISQTIVVIILLVALFCLASAAEFSAVLLTGLIAFAVYLMLKKKVRAITQKLTELEAEQARITWPAIRGIREVIIHRQQDAFSQYFSQIQKKMRRLRLWLAVLQPSPPWLLELAGIGILLLIVFYMRASGAAVDHIAGTIVILFAICWRFLPSLSKAVNSLLQMQASLPYLERVIMRLDDVEHAEAQRGTDNTAIAFARTVQLQGISFRYPSTPGDAPDVVSNINLSVTKGTMVGFVGLPGSGKSTLAGLLTGLFAPTSGAVLIDGQPLSAASRQRWTASLGYVPQTPFVLHDSIANNIAFSRWGQPVDEQRIMHTCQLSSMDFINDLPDGIHTVVGENGVRLSGGQIQKIAIARALYAQPQLIFFDEATNSLDEASEQAILRALVKLHTHATVLMVTHRLNALASCDVIHWVENGGIRCSGESGYVLDQYRDFLARREYKP